MKRRVEDLHAASMLTGDAILEEGIIPIERLLSQEVVPLSTLNNVLVLVLDGMSVSTAAELVSELTLSGWNEIVHSATKRRDTAVAMLPTVTDFLVPRCSLVSRSQATNRLRSLGSLPLAMVLSFIRMTCALMQDTRCRPL